MNWDISILEDLVIVKTSGNFDYAQIKEMTKDTFNTASKNEIRKILGDHRDLVPQVSVLDLYNLPRDLLKEGVKSPAKLAVVFSAVSPRKEDFDFFETTASNVGLYVQLFTNLEDARTWLSL